jgi:hypothetical protein
MNADHISALRTGPPSFFVFNKKSYSGLPYGPEIVDHAHAIPGPIAFIQAVQPVAGKTVATEAVPGPASHYLFTGLYPAHNAGLRFETVVTPASGACIPVSPVGPAEAAVHPAASDQRGTHCFCLCRFSGVVMAALLLPALSLYDTRDITSPLSPLQEPGLLS